MPKSCGWEDLDFLSNGKMKPEKQQGETQGQGEGRQRGEAVRGTEGT